MMAAVYFVGIAALLIAPETRANRCRRTEGWRSGVQRQSANLMQASPAARPHLPPASARGDHSGPGLGGEGVGRLGGSGVHASRWSGRRSRWS
jgi:hypothetical protein